MAWDGVSAGAYALQGWTPGDGGRTTTPAVHYPMRG